jgi:hypothetical protein
MFNTFKSSVVDAYEDRGTGYAILTAIVCLGLCFGIWCGIAALFMVCWNGAVVPAISVCSTMGFWQSFVFCLAFDFFFTLTIGGKCKSNND